MVVAIGPLDGDVKLDSRINSNYRWWDGTDNVRLNVHVDKITAASQVFAVLQGGGYPAP